MLFKSKNINYLKETIYTNLSLFIKYIQVGFFNNLLGYVIYLFGTSFGLHPIFMMTILFIVTTCFSYFFNKRYTFRIRGNDRKLFIKYLISLFSAYLIDFFLLYYFSVINTFPHQIIMLIATILVGIYSFLLSRYFVFKKWK